MVSASYSVNFHSNIANMLMLVMTYVANDPISKINKKKQLLDEL